MEKPVDELEKLMDEVEGRGVGYFHLSSDEDVPEPKKKKTASGRASPVLTRASHPKCTWCGRNSLHRDEHFTSIYRCHECAKKCCVRVGDVPRPMCPWCNTGAWGCCVVEGEKGVCIECFNAWRRGIDYWTNVLDAQTTLAQLVKKMVKENSHAFWKGLDAAQGRK